MSSSASMASTGFDRFGLHEALVRGIRAAGFDNPRPIQVETIPAGLAGPRRAGPGPDRHRQDGGLRAAPARPAPRRTPARARASWCSPPPGSWPPRSRTRSALLSQFTRLKTVTIYGGVSMQQPDQRAAPAARRSWSAARAACSTCSSRACCASARSRPSCSTRPTTCSTWASCRTSAGSSRRCPKRRQNLLFSATMPKEIRRLADELLREPARRRAGGRRAGRDHRSRAVSGRGGSASATCSSTCSRSDDCDSAIVFTRTKHRASAWPTS